MDDQLVTVDPFTGCDGVDQLLGDLSGFLDVDTPANRFAGPQATDSQAASMTSGSNARIMVASTGFGCLVAPAIKTQDKPRPVDPSPQVPAAFTSQLDDPPFASNVCSLFLPARPLSPSPSTASSCALGRLRQKRCSESEAACDCFWSCREYLARRLLSWGTSWRGSQTGCAGACAPGRLGRRQRPEHLRRRSRNGRWRRSTRR